MQEIGRGGAGGWRGRLRRHPVITGVFVGGTIAGMLLGPFFLNPEWSLLRRVLAGAVAGAGIGLLMTATKLFD